jgi:hypothetical protein
VPQQDEQLECAHYERDEPEHKRVELETEVLRRGVAWAEVEVEVATPLGYPRPGRLGAVSYIP